MTFIVFSFIISVVMIMRKRIVIIGAILILIGIALAGMNIEKVTVLEEPKEESAMLKHLTFASQPAQKQAAFSINDFGFVSGLLLIFGGLWFLAKREDYKFFQGLGT